MDTTHLVDTISTGAKPRQWGHLMHIKTTQNHSTQLATRREAEHQEAEHQRDATPGVWGLRRHFAAMLALAAIASSSLFGATPASKTEANPAEAISPAPISAAMSTMTSKGKIITGYPSLLLDEMQNNLVTRSLLVRDAVKKISNDFNQSFIVLDGRLPGGDWGDTMYKDGAFFVVIDQEKCLRDRVDPSLALAHEIKHVLDGAENPQRFTKDYRYYARTGSYSFNPYEVAARKFAVQVSAELMPTR